MKEPNELLELIEQLEKIFVYKNEILIYNKETQNKVNILLEKIAILTNTFYKNIKNERKNIKRELTITNTITCDKTELVDIDSMEERVKNILKDNDIFSCLKTLALSNKCSHSFDGEIDSIRRKFIKYYDILYPNEIDKLYPTDEDKRKGITFFQTTAEKFSNIINYNKYNLYDISDNDFEKLYNALCSNQEIKKGMKISALRQVGIDFNIQNEEEINLKFSNLRKDKERLLNDYILKKYNEGMKQVELQNKMFAIKDYYISMVGQLLINGTLRNINYELIKTINAEPGFEYMLIIDDKELSYYIEVHMPNFIANSLIKEYGMIESKERTTQKLGASAVYKREQAEVKKVYEALNDDYIIENRARAEIISRDYDPDSFEIENQTDNIEKSDKTEFQIKKNNDNYIFITNRIVNEATEFEQFLEHKSKYKDELKRNKLIQLNENYSENMTKSIVYNNYLNIYKSFNEKDKIEFISFSLNILKTGDAFDKALFDHIKRDYLKYDLDLISKIIIYKNSLKKDFLNKNIDNINEILYDAKKLNNKHKIIDNSLNYINDIKIKKDIDLLINKYINNNIEYKFDKEINEDEPKHKK